MYAYLSYGQVKFSMDKYIIVIYLSLDEKILIFPHQDILIFSFSFVVHYILEEKTSHSGKVSFHSDKQGHKYLALVSVKYVYDITTRQPPI